MNKKQVIKNISLSTVLVTLLASCGGGGGSSKYSNTGKNLSKYEYASCVDLNANASCEDNEKSLKPEDYPTVDVTAQNNNHLMGLPTADKVSVESTLLYNEMRFNSLSKQEAQNELIRKYGGKVAQGTVLAANTSTSQTNLSLNLSEKQRIYFIESLSNAVNTHTTSNPNQVIAAVCKKFQEAKNNIPAYYKGNPFTVSKAEVQANNVVLTRIDISKYDEKNWDLNTIGDTIGKVKTGDSSLLMQLGASKLAAREGLTDVQKDLITAERIVSLNGNGNKLIAGSQYHNALTIIDYDTNKDKLMYQKFAAFRVNYNTRTGGMFEPTTSSTTEAGGSTGGGSTGGSTGGTSGSSGGSGAVAASISNFSSNNYVSVSAVSNNHHNYTDNYSDEKNTLGLWEHKLVDAQIDAYGNNVFALIKPKIEGLSFNYTYKTTFGLYKIDIGSQGVYPYADDSTKKINSYDINKFKITKDGEKVVVYGGDGAKTNEKFYLKVLDKDLRFTPGTGLEIEGIKDFVITNDNKYIVASIEGTPVEKEKLVRLNITNLKDKKELSINYPIDNIFTYTNGTKALIINKLSKKVIVVDLSTMKQTREYNYKTAGRLFSMSKNGRYLAIASLDTIDIYDLKNNSFNLVNSIKTDISNIRGQKYNYETNYISMLSFIGNSMLSFTKFQEKNAITTYKIKDTKILQTPDNKLQLALDSITKESINSSYEFDKITSDLNLIKSFKDINISYKVNNTIGTQLNPNTGKVTRGSDDVSGRLTVTASLNGQTKQKVINITILKAVPKISSSIPTMGELSSQMILAKTTKVVSNSDASKVVTYSIKNGKEGLNIFSIEGDKLNFTGGNSANFASDTKGKLADDVLLNLAFLNNNNTIVVAKKSTDAFENFSSLYLQEINDDNTLSERITPRGLTYPISVTFNSNKNLVAVFRNDIIKKEKDFYADIYEIAGKSISEKPIRTIRLNGVDYQKDVTPAINEDATVMYHINKDYVFKNVHKDKTSSTTTSLRVDNLNGVYYFNNRVFVTTTKGLIVSFDKDLNPSTKQEFSLGENTTINKLKYKNDKIYAFTNSGVYVLSLDSSNILKGIKKYQTNSINGTVSSDEQIISIRHNSTYNSTISYTK